VARATASQTRVRFEKRHEAKIRDRLEIPEVRDAFAAIRRGAEHRFRSGEPVEVRYPEADGPIRGFAEPFWLELVVCRRNGVIVQVNDRGSDPPELDLSLSPKAEQEGLAARFLYPQDFRRSSQYDLWEIRRDAPLSRILEDVEYQWREMHAERARLLGKGESTVRRAITDLCKRTGLPWPMKGTVLPDHPKADCDNCPERRSPSEPCADCKWLIYVNKHIGPPELPKVNREPPRDVH
jgi:hypothetical protein